MCIGQDVQVVVDLGVERLQRQAMNMSTEQLRKELLEMGENPDELPSYVLEAIQREMSK